MFDTVTERELCFYCPTLLRTAELRPTRKANEKKIVVRRIEEVMADIKM
jgi:hypothetical protein